MSFTEQFQNYDFPMLNLVRLPEITIDNKIKEELNLNKDCSNLNILAALAYRGLEKKKNKISADKLDIYKERIKLELDLVNELSFTDYFLLIWEVTNKAREFGAFIDFGRGSACASILLWLLEITGVDPIAKNLILSRFISKVRAKKQIIDGITYLQGDLCPDYDANVSIARPKIVEWLNEVYKGRVCKISNVSTLTGKILIKDVYKSLENVSEEDAKYIADLIEKHSGIVEDIEQMPEKNSEFKKWTEKHKYTFETALKLRDLIRQKSTHASGYIISFYPLDGFVPLEINKEKELVLSYEMKDAAKIALKLDLLGLTSNEIIKDILENIPEKVEDMNLEDDPIIYDQFQNNNLLPYGLYQISADCAYRVTSHVKPKNIFELSDVSAISRPGALDYLDSYVKNTAKCPHPVFENALKSSRNLCLYQEQMMQMAMAVGFSAENSELLRRIVGKKLVDQVKIWKEKIYETCEKNNFNKEIGDILWKILEDSSFYSFNLSHSISTSYLSALTVYLKYKYPLQFYTACLRSVKNLANPIEEITAISKELRFFNIKLLPPNIIKSDLDFKIEDNSIRFSLAHIKGISDKSIEKLNKFRNKEKLNKFQIFHAANEAGIPINILSSLIMVGSLDDMLTETRSRTFMEACLWNLLTDKEKILALQYGEEYNFHLTNLVRDFNEKRKNEKGKPLITDKRRATLKKNFAGFYEIYNFNKDNENFCAYWFEKALLGYSYSYTLRDIFADKFGKYLLNIAEVKESFNDEIVWFIGTVKEAKMGKSKEKETPYLKLQVEDETGEMKVMIFESARNANLSKHLAENGKYAAENDIVIIKGKRKEDVVFAESIGIQSYKILTKISELEKKLDKKQEIE